MATVFIIHGAYGHPEENWFPWLKHELENKGHEVFVPQFPTPENQTLDNWMTVFDQYRERLAPSSIVIGHSLGTAFLLNVLEENQAKAAFFVAGVNGPVENEFDEGMKTFSHRIFDWKRIRENCQTSFVIHSDNDPYIPLDHAKQLAEHLGVDVTLVSDAGHFNEKAGYTRFPFLLGLVKKLLQ